MDAVRSQSSFTAGEISDHLYARDDLALYETAARRIENFIVMPYGGLDPRGGTEFIAAIHDQTRKARLKRFVFKRTDTHMLEFGHQVVRIYRNRALVTSGGTPVVVATPYTEDQLDALQFTQTADELFIVHESHAPRKLQRLSLTNWQLVVAPRKNGPFRPENTDRTVTISASGAAGTVTLTASGAVFNPGMVGTALRLIEVDQDAVPEWEGAPVNFAVGDRARSLGKVYEVVADPGDAVNPPTHSEGLWKSGTSADGPVWRFIHDGRGVVNLTGYTSPTVMTGTVDASGANLALPEGVVSPRATYRWSEAGWSDARGWPGCISFFEQRFVYARWPGEPQGFALTKSGSNDDFGTGDKADDAISYVLGYPEMSGIQWIAAAQSLVFGTMGPTFVARGSTDSEALSATNISARPQAAEGASPVPPVSTGSEILFVDRTGHSLHELTYSFEANGYKAPDNTVRSDHISGAGFAQLAFQQKPYRVVWALRADGVLAGFTYMPDQDIRAWHRHFTRDGDRIEAIETIPAPDGKIDELWWIARRTIDGQVRRYVEYMHAPFDGRGRTDGADAWFLDCALEYDGAPADTIAGLAHLEGETVAVWADGAAHPDRVVSGGAIALNRAARRAVVGLDFVSEVETLDAYQALADGSGSVRRKFVGQVVAQVKDAIGGEISANGGRSWEPIFHLAGSAPMGSGPRLRSGKKTVHPSQGEDSEGRIAVRRMKGAPMKLLALRPAYTYGAV